MPFAPGEGRTPITIDWEKVDKLLQAGCLGTEVAAALGCSAETLYRRVHDQYQCSFVDYQAKMRAKGESCLRAIQFEKAVELKDNCMLVWLGKQRLNQKEPSRDDQSNNKYIVVVQKDDGSLYTGLPANTAPVSPSPLPITSDQSPQ